MNLQKTKNVFNQNACRKLATAVLKKAILDEDYYFLNSENSQLYRDLCENELTYITVNQVKVFKKKREKKAKERRLSTIHKISNKIKNKEFTV